MGWGDGQEVLMCHSWQYHDSGVEDETPVPLNNIEVHFFFLLKDLEPSLPYRKNFI